MQKKLIPLVIALIAAITASFAVPCVRSARELGGKLIRLHIVADSDTIDAQAEKLRVRDNVLSLISEHLDGVSDKSEAQTLIVSMLPEIKAIAGDTASRPVEVSLCTEYFGTRTYDTFALPAGNYTSLRIRIGESRGRNWWCVVFPPVCTTSFTEWDDTPLTADETLFVTRSGIKYRVHFKAADICEKILHFAEGL